MPDLSIDDVARIVSITSGTLTIAALPLAVVGVIIAYQPRLASGH